MANSFFFYDLETSGFNAHTARIMQFAGQRTDMDLNPVGEPVNLLIKMTDDILPDPGAVLITGITPQMTLADGVTEAEFLQIFTKEVATPGTIFVGYNTVRFDDEFMRTLHYRNFYDPYEWQWQDGRSRWDLLDVVRMTRALRPDGIEWPVDAQGKATNRLELISALNKLEHENAHDALSDVMATIGVAKLIRSQNTKLFDYLLEMRDKKKITQLADKSEPFVYASGRYSSEYHKTTAVAPLGTHPKKPGSALVYNLRYDPTPYKNLSPEQLAEAMRWKKDTTEADRVPVKQLQYNRCPAVAPLGVLDQKSQERLQLDPNVIAKHYKTLRSMDDFTIRLHQALDILEKQKQTQFITTDKDADERLYDGFFADQDKQHMRVVRAAAPYELSSLELPFKDSRLSALLPLYKARNHSKHLNDEERTAWEQFRIRKLLGSGNNGAMAQFFTRLQEAATRSGVTQNQHYLLEELKLYAESIMPADVAA